MEGTDRAPVTQAIRSPLKSLLNVALRSPIGLSNVASAGLSQCIPLPQNAVNSLLLHQLQLQLSPAMKQRILSYRKAPVTQAKRPSLFHCSRVLLSSSAADLFTHRLIHTSDRGQLHLLPPLGPVRVMYTPS